MIYVDSSILLDVITGSHYFKARRAARVLGAIAAGRARGIASWLVLAEVVSAPGAAVPENIREHVERILEHSDLLEWSELERLTACEARNLGRRFPGLSGADAVHLATALRRGADYLFTSDDKLIRKLHGRGDTSPVQVGQLTVQQPALVWDADMFESSEDHADREQERQEDERRRESGNRASTEAATPPAVRRRPRPP